MTAYEDHNSNTLITDFTAIVKRYLKTWFFLDIIAIIPFDLMLRSSDSVKIVKLVRLGRLVRLLRIFKVLD